MKAWLLKDFKGLDGLVLEQDVPVPEPGPGEVRLRLTHAALNPADRFLAERLYPARPPLPHILGRDGCGVVDAVGQGVATPRVGERVVILRGDTGVEKPGTFAQYVVVPAEEVAPVPESWSDAQAAGAALVYETAHQALKQWGPLKPTTVLISGVSGGVGIASLHLARAWECRVVGLTRSRAKHERLREHGCDLILDPGTDDLREQVKQSTGGAGAGLAVDTIGGTVLPKLIDALGYAGRVSVVGMLAGPVPDFNTAKLLFKRIRIGGVHVGDYNPEQAQAAWREVKEALSRIQAKPVVDRIFPMTQLIDAFHHLAAGAFGKVVLDVR